MVLKVLVDNNTYIDQYYCGEPAVSYYIEDEDKKILLDVGYSDLFLKNMRKLGIEINDIDTIAISHGHDDHTRGFKFLFLNQEESNISVIGHRRAFDEKTYDGEEIGSPYNILELKDKCNLILANNPVRISPNITFLGEIPQVMDFETRVKIGKTVHEEISIDDYVEDDSALVYKGEDGIYIITGCSHSGICNIIEYAKNVTGCDNVLGVIGGFHLFEVSERVNKTIEYFQENNIKELYPCHCTAFKVRAAIDNLIPITEVGVGLSIEWV